MPLFRVPFGAVPLGFNSNAECLWTLNHGVAKRHHLLTSPDRRCHLGQRH